MVTTASFAAGFVGLWNSLWTLLFYIWPFLLLIVIIMNKIMWRKYPLEAVIIEKRGDNLIKTNDRIGKFYDNYGDMTYYGMQKSKDKIPVYNFDWVLHNVSVPTNLLERYVNLVRGNVGSVFLFRYGSKQYKPIDIKPGNGSIKKFAPIKNEKGEDVYSYQYIQFDPRKIIGTLDFEVIDWDNMNFMVQEQRASIIRRQRKGEKLLTFVIPAMIIGAAVLVAIFILKFSMDVGTDLRSGAGSVQEAPAQGAMSESKIGGALNNIVTPGQ